MSRVTLITGGTRSGKSRFAVELAQRCGTRIVYVATGRATDREMQRRIARHRRERPRHWRTIEHPADPARSLSRLDGTADGAIVDCLTMYVSALLLAKQSEAEIARQVTRLCAAARRARCPVVLVTNEVGSGLVPEYPLGRTFRDLAGRMNQLTAQQADVVYLMVAGLPLLVKGAQYADVTTAHAAAR